MAMTITLRVGKTGILRLGDWVGIRCLSASTVKQGNRKEDYPPNNSITPTFVNNRNPHNLEKLRLAEKVTGWDLEKPGRSFWNKLVLEITGKHITAKIVHIQGQTPVTASTNEWCIKKYLYSTKDATAARAVGEVLARRCLQTGITEVACFFSNEERGKDKVGTIIKALEDGGVLLEEPGQIEMPWSLNYPILPEKSWDIHEEIEDEFPDTDKIVPLIEKANSVRKSK